MMMGVHLRVGGCKQSLLHGLKKLTPDVILSRTRLWDEDDDRETEDDKTMARVKLYIGSGLAGSPAAGHKAGDTAHTFS